MKVRLLLLLFIFLAACASSPAAVPAATSTQPPAQVEAPAAVQVSTAAGSATHTLTVGEDLTFTILVSGAETTFRIEGQCLEEGIVLMDTGLSTTSQSDSGSGGILATNQEGLTLPHDIHSNNWSKNSKLQGWSSLAVMRFWIRFWRI